MMINRLTQMLEMQKTLDDRILNGKPYPTEQMEIALYAELGELLNELPTLFKHWKKTAVDNRSKALVELVDCFHFALSLEISSYEQLCKDDGEVFSLQDLALQLGSIEPANCDNLPTLLSVVLFNPIIAMLQIAKLLDFTFDEIFEAYIEKNKINHQRQDENY